MPQPSGFFAGSAGISKPPVGLLAQCGACGLYRFCRSPKMAVTGEGRKGILVVYTAPDGFDDMQGSYFSGDAGSSLRRELSAVGIDLDRDCWHTAAIICRPGEDRPPADNEIEYCRPNIVQTIRDLRPLKLMLLGGAATRSVLGWLWKSGVGELAQWVGWRIPSQRINAWVCPMYDPKNPARSGPNDVMGLLFRQHLVSFAELGSRPWDVLPSMDVEIAFDEDRAVSVIDRMIAQGAPVVVDYETNRLKPDPDNARIVCCGLSCAGRKTIAFPWLPKIAAAVGRLLQSPLPKIAANIKFEERWTQKFFGFGVNNWVWDTMQAAHILDNRPGITSVKFQAFVLFGQDLYNEHIDPYLENENEQGVNRIRDIAMSQLLKYCGMDCLLEWRIAEHQWKTFGWRPDGI